MTLSFCTKVIFHLRICSFKFVVSGKNWATLKLFSKFYASTPVRSMLKISFFGEIYIKKSRAALFPEITNYKWHIARFGNILNDRRSKSKNTRHGSMAFQHLGQGSSKRLDITPFALYLSRNPMWPSTRSFIVQGAEVLYCDKLISMPTYKVWCELNKEWRDFWGVIERYY